MKKLLYPFVLILTAFLIINSCSAEEDTTPTPSIIQTPEPEENKNIADMNEEIVNLLLLALKENTPNFYKEFLTNY